MKSRTSGGNGKGQYPAISAAYWQPAPTPGPYIVPGTFWRISKIRKIPPFDEIFIFMEETH